MQYIALASETDFNGWRQAARDLMLRGVHPADVVWSVHGGTPELFETSATPPVAAP